MSPHPAGTVAIVAVSLASGAFFGRGYFALLHRWAAAYAARAPALGLAASALVRIGAAVAFFALSAHWGALALLASFVGFLLARAYAVRGARRAS